jgi:hypothetical protein
MTGQRARSVTRTVRLVIGALLVAATGFALLPPSAAAVPTFTGTRIVIAGDISCPPGWCNDNAAALATAALVDSLNPTLTIIAGDIQYENNERANYENPGGFNDNWGSLPPASLYAAVGNHEYRVGSYAFDYWGDHLAPNQTTWYPLNVNLPSGGHWRILVLDSNCGTWRPQPTCGRYDPMANFIRSALSNDNARCELLVWHEPAFATRAPYPGKAAMRIPWWIAEYRKADLVVSGHNHAYEYHYQQNYTGARDRAGMRQIIVGTGGRSLTPFSGTVWPNSYYRNASGYGVLVLDLAASGWQSSFRTTRGEILDRHSVGCRW